MTAARPVTLAVIIGAHGVGGEVRLKVFAESIGGLKAHKSFNDGALTLKSLRDGNNVIARFIEIPDRTTAERMRGTELTVPRDALPPLPYAAAVYAVSTLFLLPLALYLGLHAGMPRPQSSLAILGLALIPTLIGHTLVQRVARRAPPVLVALVSPGETVGSLAIGALLLHTAPTPREGIGCALVLAGATLAVTGRSPVRESHGVSESPMLRDSD